MDFFLMRSFMDPEVRLLVPNPQRFLLEISRDNILDEAL